MFREYNEKHFYDDKIPPDKYTPLTNTEQQYISKAELTDVLKHHFKANKSSGLSKMPLQLLKHMGPKGVQCLASFLNASAID